MSTLTKLCVSARALSFATEAAVTEWAVSVRGKRRAFAEHIHRPARLVAESINSPFILNISCDGLFRIAENLASVTIMAFGMAQICAGYHPHWNRPVTVPELPFLGANMLEEKVAVSDAVYDHPAVAEDMVQWNAKLITTSLMPQYNLVSIGDPRTTLDRFKGMCVRRATSARPSRLWARCPPP